MDAVPSVAGSVSPRISVAVRILWYSRHSRRTGHGVCVTEAACAPADCPSQSLSSV
jgi:hypothetical protein